MNKLQAYEEMITKILHNNHNLETEGTEGTEGCEAIVSDMK